jgi:hypothetical protein
MHFPAGIGYAGTARLVGRNSHPEFNYRIDRPTLAILQPEEFSDFLLDRGYLVILRALALYLSDWSVSIASIEGHTRFPLTLGLEATNRGLKSISANITYRYPMDRYTSVKRLNL